MTTLIASGGELAVTEPVLMEVLAGARTESRQSDLRRLAWRHNAVLLSWDSGIARLADVVGLQLDDASRRA
ncbi:hypothetical protein [Ruania zhangjianzhongii]|uniref:hypothetical protein n=1 Tax=Ruania zhangjianzhongii TaxID=2603206 RepID=UPI001F3AC797|nr:hypothetical protein [Ruania zhangjianzhongii]